MSLTPKSTPFCEFQNGSSSERDSSRYAFCQRSMVMQYSSRVPDVCASVRCDYRSAHGSRDSETEGKSHRKYCWPSGKVDTSLQGYWQCMNLKKQYRQSEERHVYSTLLYYKVFETCWKSPEYPERIRPPAAEVFKDPATVEAFEDANSESENVDSKWLKFISFQLLKKRTHSQRTPRPQDPVCLPHGD